jgi:hypothetical protein
MDDFETTLGRRLKEASADVEVPPAMRSRVLRRSKVGRAGSVLAGALAAFVLVAGALAVTGDPRVSEAPTPPAGVVPAVTPYAAAPLTGGCGVEGVKEDRGSIPDGAVCAWSAPGDVDGDGDLETISTYGEPNDTGEGGGENGARWFLSVLEPNHKIARPLDEPTFSSFMPYEPRLIGTVDANGDGTSEIFVALAVGNGATGGIFSLREDGLHPVVESSPTDQLVGEEGRFLFGVAASAAHRMGMSCEKDPDGTPVLLVREAGATESGDFKITTSRYQWESPTLLRPDGTSEERVGGEDPLVRASQSVDCFGLEWGV